MTRTTCFAAIALFITTSSALADGSGFYSQPGWSDGGTDGGVKYFHGDDGSNGWQTNTGGNAYYHDDHKNCSTNIGAATQTSCIRY